MLLRNIDIEHGLVNSAMGNVTGFYEDQNTSLTKVVFVKFDHVSPESIVANKYTPLAPPGSLPILQHSEQFLNHHITREQFPLRLAFATSIHKVQGITCSSICVSMENMFEAGQAYVALSRVTSLDGLFINDLSFERKANAGIYCNEKITFFLARMKELDFTAVQPFSHDSSYSIRLVHLNVEGFNSHLCDIIANDQLLKSNIFVATEMWLSAENEQTCQLSGYSVVHRPRYKCSYYLSSHKHGGVSIFVKDGVQYFPVTLSPMDDIECCVISIPSLGCIVIGVYRAPSFPCAFFAEKLEQILQNHVVQKHRIKIVIGDLNENLLVAGTHMIFTLLRHYGFHQLIVKPTTSSDTLLDVIYFNGPETDYKSGVLQTYFGYHDAVYLEF